jgi:ABC-2 type transport system ATP-binding protein
MPASPAIDVEALRKTYGGGLWGRSVEALGGVNLTVQPGAIFGLLGPNGAGKTTLVKILLGLAHPSEGRAALFGTPAGDSEARERVGLLPERHPIPEFLTARQFLDYYGQLADVGQPRRDRRIARLLERVEMADWAKERVGAFSKGMRQRLGLAQALMGDPDLLFLDEPTDGVDPVGRRRIRDLLVELRDQGKTIFVNSHLLSEVEKVCSRVAILKDGKLVREGTVAELTTAERRYRIVTTPLPDALVQSLDGELRLQGTTDDGLERRTVLAGGRGALNAVLDRLRDAGVELEAVEPARKTLEDSFIDVVA